MKSDCNDVKVLVGQCVSYVAEAVPGQSSHRSFTIILYLITINYSIHIKTLKARVETSMRHLFNVKCFNIGLFHEYGLIKRGFKSSFVLRPWEKS